MIKHSDWFIWGTHARYACTVNCVGYSKCSNFSMAKALCSRPDQCSFGAGVIPSDVEHDSCAIYVPTLQTRFGFGALKPGQAEAILALLHGHDVFVRMATGSGKCLHVPPLICGKSACAVIISPVVGLMANQVRSVYYNVTYDPAWVWYFVYWHDKVSRLSWQSCMLVGRIIESVVLLNDNVEFILHLRSTQSFPLIVPIASIKGFSPAMTFDPTAKIQISTR